MSIKQRAYKLAETLGVEITDYGNCLDIAAPIGKAFDGDTHLRTYDLEWEGRAGLWKDVIEDLRTLTNCSKSEACEWCEGAAA